jgi:O-antigen/teichoic acid export membrane protein
MGPADFGVVTTAIALMTTVVGMTDLGLGTTGVRFISEYLHKNVPRAHAFLKVIFKIEIGIGLLILAVGILAAPVLATFIGQSTNPSYALLALVGAAALSTGAFYTITLQAYQRFAFYSILGIINGASRLVILGALFATDNFTILNVIAAYAFAPFAGLIIGYFAIPRDFLNVKNPALEKEVIPEIIAFGKWTMLSFFVMSLVSRLDVLVLGRNASAADVGQYGAAIQLITAMPLLVGSITSVLLPKSGSMATIAQLRAFVKKSLAGSFVVFLCLLPFVLFSGYLITLLFGEQYRAATPLFQILAWGYMLSLFINPVSIVLFRLNKPQYAALGNVVQFVTGIVLYTLLIPRFGAEGAAWSNAIVSVAGSIIIIPAVIGLLRQPDREI